MENLADNLELQIPPNMNKQINQFNFPPV